MPGGAAGDGGVEAVGEVGHGSAPSVSWLNTRRRAARARDCKDLTAPAVKRFGHHLLRQGCLARQAISVDVHPLAIGVINLAQGVFIGFLRAAQ